MGRRRQSKGVRIMMPELRKELENKYKNLTNASRAMGRGDDFLGDLFRRYAVTVPESYITEINEKLPLDPWRFAKKNATKCDDRQITFEECLPEKKAADPEPKEEILDGLCFSKEFIDDLPDKIADAVDEIRESFERLVEMHRKRNIFVELTPMYGPSESKLYINIDMIALVQDYEGGNSKVKLTNGVETIVRESFTEIAEKARR